MRTRLLMIPAALALAALSVSCSGSDSTVSGGCSGKVTSESQSGKTVTINGNFASGQPIMELSQNGNRIATEVAVNYTSGQATFDVTGLATGTYTVQWVISCFNEDGEVVMSSTITTVNIT